MKKLMILLIAVLLFGAFDTAFAEMPVYMVEVISDEFNFTGHKRFGDLYPEEGDSWTETVEYMGLPVELQFLYESVTETVVTPAGTFENCSKLRLWVYLWPFIDEIFYWYNAENVGRVKITTEDGDVLLSDYNIEGGMGYDPAAIGNWWLYDDGNRPAIVAYEDNSGYPCYRTEDPDQSTVGWIHIPDQPAPELPDNYIFMIPEFIPTVAAPGGYFKFTGVVGNTTDNNISSDVWVMLDVPGYGMYGPVQRFNNIPLSPRSALVYAGARQNVPGIAPVGMYDYIGYCGDYPNTIADEWSFPFEVVAGRGGASDQWQIAGWFEDSDLPSSVDLGANYPNPFNATTSISYSLTASASVTLEIFNMMGQKVTTLVNGNESAGDHVVTWDASNAASGVYFYRLKVGDEILTKRMTLLK